MFSTSSLKKILIEFENSLVKEFSKIPGTISAGEKNIFLTYKKNGSLAGMETWLVAFSESQYFLDAERELKKISDKPPVLEDFQKDLFRDMQENFGEEDFRFLKWERCKPKKKNLKSLLTQYQKEVKKILSSLNPDLLSEKDPYHFYKKTDADPSEKGAGTKFLVKKTPKTKIEQIRLAEEELKLLWKEGFAFYQLLTRKINLVQSPGLVSYSHFTEPGVSYINFLDRDLFDSVDDLVHENSHHHLNLILKKYKILKKKDFDRVFYSPWRRSLRSLYAILHASFTFSFGAKLFYEILNSSNLTKSRLSIYRERLGLRFAEETLEVEYSLQDLFSEKDSFTPGGLELLEHLAYWNRGCLDLLPEIQKKTLEKKGRKQIPDLQKTLAVARKQFSSFL